MRKSIALILLVVSTTISGLACSSNTDNPPGSSTKNTTSTPVPNEDGTNPDTNTPVEDSGSPDNEQPVNDAGGNNDTGTTPKEPTNQAECVAACETTHPTAAADNHELDNSCFFGAACGNVCNNLGQGATQFPDAVSGAKCDTASANSYPIGTPSQACSNCLASTQACCTLWIKIFGSDEGKSLSQCAHTCWDKFPN